MKKKLLMLTLAVMMTASFTVSLTACGKPDPEDPPAHECTWETSFTKDATHHWYKCTDDTCTEVKDKEEHDFVDGACSKCTYPDPDYVEDVEVIGFNTKESVVVTTGTKILLEKPEPVDQHGEKLTVYTDVTTADGKHVSLYEDVNGEYFIATEKEYKINYVVYPKDKVMTLKTTTVTSVGSPTVSLDIDKIIEVDKEFLLVAESGFYNPTFTYSVKKDGTPVTVTDGKFTPNAVGYYDITVKATSGEFSAEESYMVFARPEVMTGEVESFFYGWEDLRALNDYGTRGWKITDGKTCGVKNVNDVDDVYLTYSVKSTESAVSLWVDPVFDADYYRDLAKNGYKSVVFYLYIDTDYSVPLTFITDTINESHLNVDMGGSLVNQWTKVEINLLEDEGDYCLDRSFISGHQVYDQNKNGFLLIKNDNADDFNVYVSNIVAVKPVEVKTAESPDTDLEIGETLDLSTLFTCEESCDYYVTNLTSKITEKVDVNYKFKASGDYQVKAVPVRSDYDGNAVITVSVTDDVVMEKSWAKVKMTENTLGVKFSDLGISLVNGTEKVDVKVIGVYFHDDYKVDFDENGFTATKAGYYKLFLEGSFGDGLTTYKQFDLDVYTEEDALKLTNSKDLIATRYWSYQKLPTVSYEEYTIRDVTDTMFSYRASTGAMVVYFRPMYSKAYYQDLIDNNDTCEVLFRFYTENKTGKDLYAKFIDTYGQKNMIDYDHEQLIDLSYFVTNYDKFASGYARELKVVQSGGNPVYDFVTNRYDYLLATNNNSGNNIYFRDMPILISYTDETENLIEVSSLTEKDFDATTTMNADAKAVVNGYDQKDVTYRYVDVFGKVVNGKTIDTSVATNKRLWNFQALFGENIIYSGSVDIYDKNDGFVWNTDSKWTLYTGEVFTNRGNGVESSMEKGDGTVKTTEFTAKDDYIGGTNYLTFANRPMHSKTYYQAYAGKVTFSYSVYCEILDKDGNADSTSKFAANMIAIHSRWNYKTQVSTDANLNNTWFDRTFKIDAILEKWTYAECEGLRVKDWADRENYGMFFIYNPQNETTVGTHSVHVTDLTLTVAE